MRKHWVEIASWMWMLLACVALFTHGLAETALCVIASNVTRIPWPDKGAK